MNNEKILERTIQVLSDVTETPVENLTEKSSQDTVSNWDSVKHLDLILSLEEEFGIEFPLEEVGKMTSVSYIINVIQHQL